MLLFITSQEKTLESPTNPRFGRTPYFIKYDLENKSWESYLNQAVNQGGGAGVAASQFLIDHEAAVAISGRFGPNAYRALKAAGIKMMTFNDNSQTISDVINEFINNQLEEVN